MHKHMSPLLYSAKAKTATNSAVVLDCHLESRTWPMCMLSQYGEHFMHSNLKITPRVEELLSGQKKLLCEAWPSVKVNARCPLHLVNNWKNYLKITLVVEVLLSEREILLCDLSAHHATLTLSSGQWLVHSAHCFNVVNICATFLQALKCYRVDTNLWQTGRQTSSAKTMSLLQYWARQVWEVFNTQSTFEINVKGSIKQVTSLTTFNKNCLHFLTRQKGALIAGSNKKHFTCSLKVLQPIMLRSFMVCRTLVTFFAIKREVWFILLFITSFISCAV